MSLGQETGFVLNHLRAQYLSIVDDDLSRRVIRPYPHDLRRQNTKEFDNLLTRIESPPIPIDVLENSELVRRLNERATNVIDELNEDMADDDEGSPHHVKDGESESAKPGLFNSIRNSLATLKTLEKSDGSGQSLITPQQSQPHQLPSHMKRQPSVAGKNVLSKLFRNSSSSSTIERRRSSASTLKHEREDDDDDYDDDDDDDDDDLSISTNDDSNTQPGDDTNIELNEDADTAPVEHGILVDQNYSDVNTTLNLDECNEGKFIYGDSISSGDDDDLLLDSDFSDDDGDVAMDSTFQSSGGRSSLTPSIRSANRRLSFDRMMGQKPKLRRRAETLAPRKMAVSESNEPVSPLAHSKSTSNLDSMNIFEKVAVVGKPKVESNLSSLIGKKQNVEKKATLEGFLFVSGDQISNKSEVLEMKVWLPTEETISIQVRKSVTVFETIGYILLTLTKSHPDVLNGGDSLKNPNKWCLRLVDDDGEPYEGSFGLLDRTKNISTFGSEEVALCRVTDAEYEANESKTPYTASTNGRSGTPSPVKATPKQQNNYYKSIIPRIDNDVKDSKPVTVQVYAHPFDQETSAMPIEVLVSDHINDILVKYTKAKGLNPNDYVLKPVNEEMVLDLNDFVSTLDGNNMLEILTKRKARLLKLARKAPFNDSVLPTINSNLTPQTLVMKSQIDDEDTQQQQKAPKRVSTSAPKFSSSFKSRNGSKQAFSLKNSQYDNSPLPQTSALTGQYRKYTVWRRLPMSFINRHERTLAIDGEYVYIMPKDERIWYDTSFKTTTFHVSQIINCKVSKRVPSNFKIVVMKPNGPKRYVFEAANTVESREIIQKLQELTQAYKINTQSLT